MSMRIERLAPSVPGRLESHPTHRALAHPYCTLQLIDPEDLHTTMCDAIQDAEKRPIVRMDEETYKLHVQFVRAHGVPKGEFTTLSNGSFGAGARNGHAED